MKINHDLMNGKLLPDGWYTAEIHEAEDVISKKTGKEMMKVTFKVFHDQDSIFVYEYYTQDHYGHKRLKNLGSAFGIDVNAIDELNPDDIVGMKLQVSLETEESKNERYDDFNRVVECKSSEENKVPVETPCTLNNKTTGTSDDNDPIPF